jgi:iron(III) transport system substrate-binding protein
MAQGSHRSGAFRLVGGLIALVFIVAACGTAATSAPSIGPSAAASAGAGASAAGGSPGASAAETPETMSLDALYALAKAEGKVTVYGGGGIIPDITPLFEARFPGITVENIDSTADDLVTRAVSEARGGRVIGDVWQSPIDTVLQMKKQDLIVDVAPAESAAYPDELKGTYWNAVELQFLVVAWNTNLVPSGTEPTGWDDLADPKWKDRLIGDPRDVQLMMTLALAKYAGDEQKAVDLFTKIAANNPEFQKGRRALAEELLPAGQRAVCFTCNSHHFPPLIAKGAPVNFELNEGIGQIVGSAVFKGAPHPMAALLMHRWLISEEGQTAYATKTAAGNERIPAIPTVAPVAKVKPTAIYLLSPEDFDKNFDHYTELWNGIFNLR